MVGPGDAAPPLVRVARELGRGLALAGHLVVTGGGGGVMAAACAGARSAGGPTLALLPGTDPDEANPWAEFVVPTGLGEGRDLLVVRSARVVVAVGGSWGTLAEVALARRAGTPVVGLAAWTPVDAAGRPVAGAVVPAADAADALRLVADLLAHPAAVAPSPPADAAGLT